MTDAIPRKNQGKPGVDMVPPELVIGAARAFAIGAAKYRGLDDFNFMRSYRYRTVYASMMRHLLAWYSGEDNDIESGLGHLDHVASNLAMLMHFVDQMPDKDDRPFSKRSAEPMGD
tara:strand:- start:1940 stop:2287 length:348 start_codon:yes stop_codon:yes gene_type:complete